MSTLEVNKITPVSGGTSITLGDSGDTFTVPSGVTITNNGTANGFGGNFESQLLHVRDEKSQNTSAGASSAGTQTRTLNTVKTNEITGASLSSNQITLPSGTYYILAFVPQRNTGINQSFLYNVTDSSNTIVGDSNRSGYENGGVNRIIGRFTIASQKVFEIKMYTEFAISTNGLGIAANQTTEVYTDVQIWKVS